MRAVAVVSLLAAGATIACARSSTTATPASATPVAATPATAAAPAGAPRPATPGQPPAGGQRRQPISPMRQDTLRKAMVAEVLESIKGRENEPAGKVFNNVQLHKDMPAKEFLAMMDEQYGRGLGMLCTNCHTDDKNWANDTRKNKVIARQMERMQRDLDVKYLKKVKELDEDIPHVTCVMCHRGTAHMPNTMDVPTAPVPQRKRG